MALSSRLARAYANLASQSTGPGCDAAKTRVNRAGLLPFHRDAVTNALRSAGKAAVVALMGDSHRSLTCVC